MRPLKTRSLPHQRLLLSFPRKPDKTMHSKIILSFLAGIALGGGGVYLMNRGAESPAEVKSKIFKMETELAQKQTEIKQLKEKSTALSVMANGEVSPEQAAESEKQAAKAKSQMDKQREMMKKRMEDRMKSKVDEQLVTLKKKLGLTEDQVETVRELLMDKFRKGDFAMKAFGAMGDDEGAASAKDQEKEIMDLMLDPQKQDREMDAKILGLLKSDQQAAYAAHQQEKRANKVEMAANKELAKLQGAMSLTAEQKDQIFSTLSQFADQEHDKPIMGMVAMIEKQPQEIERIKKESGEATANQLLGLVDELKQRQARRREALQPILSEEQMKVYENLQQSSAFDMSEMMSDMGGMEMMMMGAGAEMEMLPTPAEPSDATQSTPAAPPAN